MKEGLKKKGIGIAVPFLVGGAVGAGVALLLAPKAGNELRSDLKRFATTAKDRAVDRGKALYEGGRAAVANAIDAGKAVFVAEKEEGPHA